MVWQEMIAVKEQDERRQSPPSNKAQSLKGVSHGRMENKKIAHITRSQGWTVDCPDEPPDHGERMSSKQILDIHRSEARERPSHYQPVPSQYRTP